MISEVSGQVTDRSTYTDSQLLTLPNPVTAGNLVIIAGAVWEPVAQTITVIQASGTAIIGGFTTIASSVGANWAGQQIYSFLAYSLVAASGTLQTLTSISPGTGGAINIASDEFAGIDTITPLDVDGGSLTSNVFAPAIDNITTIASNDLIIGVMAGAIGTPITPGSGYTQIWEDESPTYIPYSIEYKLVSVPSSYSVDWDISGGGASGWTIVNAAFKPFAVASPASAVPARVLRAPLRW